MVKRTHVAVSSLADSLGDLVSRQRRRERGVNLNSFIAYTLFTVLLGGGFFALYDSRAGDLEAARAVAESERDQALERAGEMEAAATRRDHAERAAHDYYLLLQGDRDSEAIAQYSDIEQMPLSETERAVFSAGVKAARERVVDAGYLRGLDALRQGDLATAVTALRSALAYQDEGARAAQMRYHLGVALAGSGDHADAIHQLELAIAGGVAQAGIADARFVMAQALEQAGALDKARAEFEKFASANPTHARALAARRKAAQLARQSARSRRN